MEEPTKKPVKTYVNTRKVTTKSQITRLKSSRPTRKVLIGVRKPLTTKKAVELLIKGTLKRKVCRYCLNIAYPLSDLDQCLSIGGNGALYNVSIRDIVASFHPVKVVDDPNFPNRICSKCINQALQAYLFAQQCEQAGRALRNCFDDMYDKMLKLDPLEPTKKRGRQKNNPNHNVLYAEHAKVIDYAEPIRHLINSGSVSLTNESEMSEFECKKCWQVLPDVESLANHEKIHPKTMWYHCRLCGQAFAKLFHIRRHLKSKHGKNSQPKAENFMCKQCGFTSEDCNTHLQHIEKHKFKNVMEHLVERKMDELCSVCLDKGALQNLEKTIRLHGAYPELTGNRSLYNILGSTIPEKGTHKYNELLVPCYAKVLTIRKRNPNNTVVKCDEPKDKDNTFTISKPFIVSKESIDDKDFYLFVFSEPELLLQNTSLTIEEKTASKPKESQQKTKGHDDNINETGRNIAQNIFSFSYPEYFDDVDEAGNESLDYENDVEFIEESDVNKSVDETKMTVKEKVVDQTADKHKTCKFCWVFTIAGKCDVCKNTFADFTSTKIFENEDMYSTIETAIDSIVEKSKSTQQQTNKGCKYCWVYKAAGKCDYCKTSLKNITFAEKESTKTETIILEGFNGNKINIAKKRKLNETVENNKKARWECSICLTTNDGDRESCLCCDTNALEDDSIRINFGLNTSFLKGIPETSKKLQQNCTVEPNVETNKGINYSVLKTDENKEVISGNKHIIYKNEIATPLYQTTSSNDIIRDMQCSDDAANENADCENVQEVAMDIEEYNTGDKPAISLPFNPNPLQTYSSFPNAPNPINNDSRTFVTPTVQRSLNIQPKPFQFSIGSSSHEMKSARKFKRPIRRIATLNK